MRCYPAAGSPDLLAGFWERKNHFPRVYCVAVQFDYIQVLHLKCDNMCVKAGIPGMVADFKKVSRCSTPFVTLSFVLVIYVLALLYRNNTSEGAPVMPPLQLAHERRTTESHELLFKWLLKLTSLSTAVFVVYWEAAITRATDTMVLQGGIVYCWNHILGDVRVSMH